MKRNRGLGVLAITLFASTASATFAVSPLDFRIDEGRNVNAFVRDGDVAAHLVLRAGRTARILVAFPAGNSGVGLWFADAGEEVSWRLNGSPRPITRSDSSGRPLRGIQVDLVAVASRLEVRRAVLSSVRVLRDFQALGTVPDEVTAYPTRQANRINWERDRVDGAAGYLLSIEVRDGATVDTARAINTLTAAPGASEIRFTLIAMTGEKPLTPLEDESLLNTDASADTRAREVLAFLSYREKLLAGSWRFNTYFGRDTLISLALLAPVLQPPALESGIKSVLSRLAPNGEVAHEEDIGEFALLRSEKTGHLSASPIYDYAMVDDDFLLAPVVAACFLQSSEGAAHARAFLATPDELGQPWASALLRNLLWVVHRTRPFASYPRFQNLIGLKKGRVSGQWRDSEDGLGGGRYPYDVNAVLVPAALSSIDLILQSGVLDAYLSDESRRALAHAKDQQQVWEQQAAALFRVSIPAVESRARITAYAQQLGIDPQPALASITRKPLQFNGLALDASGRPIPVVHSDDGLALLLTQPVAADLERSVSAMMRPFPAGLLTGAGLLVANPA